MTTSNILSQLGSPGVSTGMKNRIINGGMVIDQRYSGTSQTVTTGDGTFVCPDRNSYQKSGAFCIATAQQVTTVPTGQGFVNSSLTTITTGGSAASGDYLTVGQRIEGFNVADLMYGTANAKTVTVSFWAQASVAGTYSGSLYSPNTTYAYINTFTLTANTWTFITLVFPGDTAHATYTGNQIGLFFRIDLGSGTNFNATAGTWQAGGFRTSGSVSLSATTGATFYITGVQLEVGSNATNFEYRPYGTELALCQRYYWQNSVALGVTTNINLSHPVQMRATPTMSVLTVNAGSGAVVSPINFTNGSTVTASLSYYQSTANTVNASGVVTSSAEL